MKRPRKEIIRISVFSFATLALAVLFISIFHGITEKLGDNPISAFDARVMSFILSFRTESLTHFARWLTMLGDAWAYTLLIPMSAIILYKLRHRWKISVEAAIILISASLLNSGLKNLISRPRPDSDMHLVHVTAFSYPSGHAMSAIAFYGFLIFLTIRFIHPPGVKWLLVLLLTLLITGIGISRIYLGVHYPSDVLAGFLAGGTWLLLCILLLELFRFRGSLAKRPAEKQHSRQ